MFRNGLVYILQFLDSTSRIYIGRSSRYLLNVGSTAIAWEYAHPIAIPNIFWTIARPTSALLHHAPTKISQHRYPRHLFTVEALAAGGGKLREVSFINQPCTEFETLIRHTPLSQWIEKLHVGNRFGPKMPAREIEFILQYIPNTRAVSIHSYLSPEILDLFSHLPHLTELALQDDFFDTVSALEFLHTTSVKPLKRICVDFPKLHGPRFRRVLMLSTFITLENLSIRDWDASPDVEFAATFSAMRALRILTLRNVKGVNLAVQHLHHATALQLLKIGFLVDRKETCPQPETLSQLLHDTSIRQLHIVLGLTQGHPAWLKNKKSQVYGGNYIYLCGLAPRLRLVEYALDNVDQ